MKINKIVITTIIVFIMMLTIVSTSFAAIVDNDNGKMRYYKNNRTFDIQGYVNGEWQSTTFIDNGYYASLKVDSKEPEDLMFSNYDDQEINGVEWDVDCNFINNGRYVKITYTLTNKEATSKNISLGGYVDVQIAGEDYATIERFENSKGLKLYNVEKNIQFSFYGKSVAGTTDIDNLWIGKYPDHDDNCFNNNTTNKIEDKDSAFAYSWVNRTLAANSTNKYSVIIGMGEVSNAPKIELDENQGDCFSADSVVIKGTIKDSDKNSKATLYYTVDDSAEKNLNELTLTNNKVDFELDLTAQNLAKGNHTVKLWAIDEIGNPSEIVEKKVYITNIKAPILNMSEEWSKETVKFTVTDTNNDAADVSKYQYKIDDGQWKDITLNVETVALDKTGTAKVYVRTVGKQEGEVSSAISKTAKVDKEKPTVTVSEKEGKVTINVNDNHSGADTAKTKYIFTKSKDLNENDELTKYTSAVEYRTADKSDVYLHVTCEDKLGNTNTFVKEYKYPVAAKIESEDEFKGKDVIYKLTDEKNQVSNNYFYQVKINDEEWKTVNLNTEYKLENPKEGNNTIKTRTIDTLGRISDETEKTVKYIIVKDETTSNEILPAAGVKSAIVIMLVFVLIALVISYYKYSYLKGIK